MIDRGGQPSENFRKALIPINGDLVGIFDDFCGVYFMCWRAMKGELLSFAERT